MNTIVKRLDPADLEWVIEADLSFPHPWKAEDWRNLSLMEQCFTLSVDAKLVGYALFRHLPGAEDGHLLKIYLNDDYRGLGLAEKLLNECIKQLGLKEVFLEVGETNLRAGKFYEKMGFKKVHLAKGFYSDGENAWLMLLTQ